MVGTNTKATHTKPVSEAFMSKYDSIWNCADGARGTLCLEQERASVTDARAHTQMLGKLFNRSIHISVFVDLCFSWRWRGAGNANLHVACSRPLVGESAASVAQNTNPAN